MLVMSSIYVRSKIANKACSAPFGYNHLISNNNKKMATKYQEFFPTLSVKTTDFQHIFNFDQMYTVTIFGEHGIMTHIP